MMSTQKFEASIDNDYESLNHKKERILSDSNNNVSHIKAVQNSKRSSFDSCLIRMHVDLDDGVTTQI